MTTTLPRINVTLPRDIRKILASLAKKRDVSASALAADLIADALEMQEDIYFSRLAAETDKPKSKYVSHDEAWK